MADRGFDPCEYVWSNEFAMQRLLFILRQTQSYCTDNECFSPSRLPGPRGVPPASDFFMTCLIIGFFILMYALRPKSLRHSRSQPAKHRDDGHGPGPNDDPPGQLRTN